jgi:hypothetical protein
MQRMSRVVAIGLLLVCLAVTVSAQESLRINVTLTWDLGLRIGIDYRPWDHVSFMADLGSTLFSLEGAFLLTGDAFVVMHAFPPESLWQLSAGVGIPDVRVVFIGPPAIELSLGASVQGAYRLSDAVDVFLRVGGGAPLFLEDGEIRYDRPAFPLGLWPDLSAGVKFGLR